MSYRVEHDSPSFLAFERLALILRAILFLSAAKEPGSLVGSRDQGLRLYRSSRAIVRARPTYVKEMKMMFKLTYGLTMTSNPIKPCPNIVIGA